MEAYMNEEFSGDENLNEILRKFTIVEKGRLNYLNKIFHDYQSEKQNPYLSHQVFMISDFLSCSVWLILLLEILPIA